MAQGSISKTALFLPTMSLCCIIVLGTIIQLDGILHRFSFHLLPFHVSQVANGSGIGAVGLVGTFLSAV